MNAATSTRPIRSLRQWLAAHLRDLILAGFVLVAFAYAFTAPMLEKNDEDNHLALVIHFAQGGGLPVQQAGEQTAWMQEGSQPPLYYWLASLPARLFDTSDFDFQVRPNASPQYAPNFPGNKNKHLLTPQKFAFHYSGSMLAAFVLRVIGILAGVATVWFTFKLAERFTGKTPVALLAMGLVAFNPMLLTVTTAVSNDGLVIALCAAALWLLAECVIDRITLRRALVLGVLLGLASLTKLSGALLLPIAILTLIAHTTVSEKRTLLDGGSYRFALVVALAWLAVAGWWFARNLALYGDLTGTATMVQVAGARTIPIDIAGEFRAYRMTFLGIFGQTNVPMAGWVYIVWDGFLLAALAGLVMAWFAHRRSLSSNQRLMFAALAGFVALVVASAVLWTTRVVASHGRLLFPALPAIAIFLAIGIAQLFHMARLPQRTVVWTALPFAILAAVTPFTTIAPAYAPPFVKDIPAGFTPIHQTLKPWAEVLAYKMEPAQVRAGDTVRVSVIMRALQVPQFDHSLVVNLYGRDATPLARFDTFNGNGLLPSSQWRAGDMWQDTVEFTLPANAVAPALLRAQFNLYNAGSGEIAESIDAEGKAGAPLYAGSTLLPLPTTAGTTPKATFGGLIALEQVRLSEAQAGQPLTLTLTLQWRSLKPAQVDYTAFVHVVDAGGNLIAQQDGPLLNGEYPSTHWGDASFVEQRNIDLPKDLHAGDYRVLIGFYDPQTGARLQALDAQGQRIADDAFAPGTFAIH